MKSHEVGVTVLPISGSGVLNANMTAIIFDKTIFVHDSGKGLQDPDTKRRYLTPLALSKVPIVIPDFTILDPYIQQGYQVKGFIITHIHGDHTGSIKNFMEYLQEKNQDPTIYCSSTVSFLLRALRIRIPPERLEYLVDRKILETPEGISLKPIALNHSTIGTMAVYYEFKEHSILYLPDFCIDHEPVIGVDQTLIDSEFYRIGRQGLNTLVCQSTLAAEGFDRLDTPPVTEAEICSRIRATLRYYTRKKAGIVVAGFATNAARTVEVIKESIAVGRRVGLIGRNVKALVDSYFGQGLIDPRLRGWVDDVSNKSNLYEVKRNYVIVTSGHQGEYLAGLTRIARDDISYKIGSNDVVLLCSRTIPKIGPIIARGDMLNNLRMRRVQCLDEGLHKSGHITGGQMTDVIYRLRPMQIIANHGDRPQVVGWHRVLATLDHHAQLVVAQNGKAIRLMPVKPSKEDKA